MSRLGLTPLTHCHERMKKRQGVCPGAFLCVHYATSCMPITLLLGCTTLDDVALLVGVGGVLGTVRTTRDDGPVALTVRTLDPVVMLELAETVLLRDRFHIEAGFVRRVRYRADLDAALDYFAGRVGVGRVLAAICAAPNELMPAPFAASSGVSADVQLTAAALALDADADALLSEVDGVSLLSFVTCVTHPECALLFFLRHTVLTLWWTLF